SQHLDNQSYDRERTAWLNAQGFKVLRFGTMMYYNKQRRLLRPSCTH
ncbi:DUF559 domain-containing protein, partial [Legionella anisa]